jgi:hypothetical protein
MSADDLPADQLSLERLALCRAEWGDLHHLPVWKSVRLEYEKLERLRLELKQAMDVAKLDRYESTLEHLDRVRVIEMLFAGRCDSGISLDFEPSFVEYIDPARQRRTVEYIDPARQRRTVEYIDPARQRRTVEYIDPARQRRSVEYIDGAPSTHGGQPIMFRHMVRLAKTDGVVQVRRFRLVGDQLDPDDTGSDCVIMDRAASQSFCDNCQDDPAPCAACARPAMQVFERQAGYTYRGYKSSCCIM